MKTLLDHAFPPILDGIYDQRLTNQLANTHAAIASLNQMTRQLHNPTLLMRPILGKEAEASSQLEGTQASIEDAYKIDIAEQTPEERNQALEIKNYEDAMFTGIEIIKKTTVSELLIREIHKTLMKGVRGSKKHPGEYRKGDVWVGPLGTTKEKARYLPPDATHVPKLLDDLLKFVNESSEIHPLIICGIMHHRFEGIHPFEDGNGRTGRLLISLYLISKGLLNLPMLYPSGFFEKDKNKYISELTKVDKNEDWYSWLLYFLQGMQNQAEVSLKIAIEIDNLFKSCREKIQNERANLNLIRVLEQTFSKPFITSSIIESDLDIPRTSAERYLQILSKNRILLDAGIIRRQRVFINEGLLGILRGI